MRNDFHVSTHQEPEEGKPLYYVIPRLRWNLRTLQEETPISVAHILNQWGWYSDYEWCSQDHEKLLMQNKSSFEIAQYLGKKLNIKCWEYGEFYGQQNVLPTPTVYEIERLRLFLNLKQRNLSFSTKGSGASDFAPGIFLLDGYISRCLFGQHNLLRVNTIMEKICEDWENMWKKYTQKEKYLKEELGLEIEWRWGCLTGMRNGKGQVFHGSNSQVYIVGAQSTRWDSSSLTLAKQYAEINPRSFSSQAGLCLLPGE